MPHTPGLPSPDFPNETLIFQVRPSFVPTFFMLVGIALLGGVLIITLTQAQAIVSPMIIASIQLAVAVVVGFALLVVFLAWFSTIYSLTDKRVDERFGIIGQHSSSIGTKEISDIKVKIGIIGKIFGFGDVQITGANETASVDFHSISNPRLRASQVETAHTNSLHTP